MWRAGYSCLDSGFVGSSLWRGEGSGVALCAHGHGNAQERDFLIKLTQEEFPKSLKTLHNYPEFCAARQHPLSPEGILLRQCKLGVLRWLATVSRPGTCARLARVASGVNSLQRGDLYHINDLGKTVQAQQQATVLKYAHAPHPGAPARGNTDARMRAEGEKIDCGTIPLVG